MKNKKSEPKQLNFEKFEVARITSTSKILGGNPPGDTPQSSIRCHREED
ncbi:hypothetical protein [Zobellia sp. B3R18]|nr:hypothetical protein [Zobellia sp. B3R18]MBU2974966.1 hypothetical protein [Zobellia sp. B3R18]